MKVLMLSPVFPWPLDMGSKIRIYYTLAELSKNNQVVFISFVNQDTSKSHFKVIEKTCEKFFFFPSKSRPKLILAFESLFSKKPYRVKKFFNRKAKKFIVELLKTENFDLIWVHFLNMLSFLPLEKTLKSTIVLDQHNADELMWNNFMKGKNLLFKFFAWQNLLKLRAFQKRILKHVDIVLSVSEEEANFTRTLVPCECKVWTAPNGVDVEYFHFLPPEKKLKNIILFCGSLDITMNIDAVLNFVNKIFPLIKKRIPNSEFWIVGRNPDKKLRKLAQREDKIQLFSNVPDVRPFYEQAKVFVSPFRFGGGTKIKVIEAMASGVPVVATNIGAQGIKALNKKHLFIEDDNKLFAFRVIELLQNEEIRRSIAQKARELVEEKYSWKSILNKTITKIEEEIRIRNKKRNLITLLGS